MNTTTHFLNKDSKITFITVWKIAGPPVTPYGITLYYSVQYVSQKQFCTPLQQPFLSDETQSKDLRM